jgi:hypothetical protein
VKNRKGMVYKMKNLKMIELNGIEFKEIKLKKVIEKNGM